MSSTTRYLRFFVSTREMTPEQARYFTEIDQVNHVAVCAVEPTDAETRGYGIARFLRDTAAPDVAEFAVAVIDPMQGRGLGTSLLAALHLLAHQRGIRELRGEVLAENPVMPEWLPRVGAALASAADPAYRLIRWPVLTVDVTGISPHFKLWLERLSDTFER